MPVWRDMSTAPKTKGAEIVVRGGELWDDLGSPSFRGMYVVYWVTHLPEFPEGAWYIKAGAHTLQYGGFAIVDSPAEWLDLEGS